jgi:hypothetical protein
MATDFILDYWYRSKDPATGEMLPMEDDEGVHISNLMREPGLLKMLNDEVKALPDTTKQDAVVAEAIRFMDEAHPKINVDRFEMIKGEDVVWLRKNFEALVKKALATETEP